jgi:hypothetical protein
VRRFVALVLLVCAACGAGGAVLDRRRPVEMHRHWWHGRSFSQDGVRVKHADVDAALREFPASRDDHGRATRYLAGGLGLAVVGDLLLVTGALSSGSDRWALVGTGIATGAGAAWLAYRSRTAYGEAVRAYNRQFMLAPYAAFVPRERGGVCWTTGVSGNLW